MESVQLSQMEQESILSDQEKPIMNSLRGKLVELFKENLRPRQDYLKRRLK